MRRTLILLSTFALAVAGCAGSPAATATAPAIVPTAVATVVPTTAPATNPPASPTAVAARVTFDGKTCAYTGPTVIPFPASLTVEYAPAAAVDTSWLAIIAVRSGTTVADLQNPDNPPIGAGTPSFVYLETHMFSEGAAKGEYRSVPSDGNPMAELGPNGPRYDTFAVFCLPELPGNPAGGFTLLRLVP